MPHTGVFTSLGNESNLDDCTDWLLLKAGVAEPNAAKAAATTYLLDEKKFHQNQTITVQGGESSLGSVRTILMTSAKAASVEASHLGLAGSKAVPGTGIKPKKKAGSSKKTTKSRSKKTAKTKPSKKKAARKAASKSGTKTKRRKSASKAARKKAKRK